MKDKKVKIYIGFNKGNSIISKVVRQFQYSGMYSHVFYIIDNKNKNNPIIIEAMPQPITERGGVYYHPLNTLHKEGEEFDVFSLEVDIFQKERIESFLKKQVGKKYDFLGILGFILRNDDIEDKNSWFCSELIFKGLEIGGVKLLNYTKPQEVYPSLLVKSPLLKYEYTQIIKSK